MRTTSRSAKRAARRAGIAGGRPAEPARRRPALRLDRAPRSGPGRGSGEGVRHSPQYLELRARFPVLDGRDDLVDELLDLYTPRNLYALHAIGSKIDTELRDAGSGGGHAPGAGGVPAAREPAQRLSRPRRVAADRGGHVRQPASRHQREVNVWRAFEEAFADVRAAIGALPRDRQEARFAADYGELGGMGAANVLWLRSRAAVVGSTCRPRASTSSLSSPPASPGIDELSYEYLATSWVLGREAAETLRLEPIFGGGRRAPAPRPPPCATGSARRSVR